MTKFSLCIFVVAVFLGGAASDHICIILQLNAVTPDKFFSDPLSACQDVEMKFDRMRKELKKCTHHAIDISLLESLYDDFCTLDSDYRQRFNRQEQCLSPIVFKTSPMSCFETVPTLDVQIFLDGLAGKPETETCTSVSQHVTKCLSDSVGNPCGPEGLEVYGRIAEAMASLFKGVCLEAASSAYRDSIQRRSRERQRDY